MNSSDPSMFLKSQFFWDLSTIDYQELVMAPKNTKAVVKNKAVEEKSRMQHEEATMAPLQSRLHRIKKAKKEEQNWVKQYGEMKAWGILGIQCKEYANKVIIENIIGI